MITVAFLDELRARTVLSAVISQSVKLTKAGREYKACCPFHNESTPSFTVNDDKGFYHCFGCSAHGDAVRWMTDHQGLGFVDAVTELAARVGMTVPAPSPAAAAKAARVDGLRPALEAAQDHFFTQIVAHRAVRYYLEDRGVSKELADAFGIGFAPAKAGYLKNIGIDLDTALAAGLAWQDDGRSGDPSTGSGRSGERFLNRIMVPVHDARGRIVSFGGRDFCLSPPGKGKPARKVAKYKNGSDTELFDKGRTLYNLHRALPAARAKPGETGRLIVVEGYFDVIGLAAVDIAEAVAPMGTALTEHQLQLAWRVHVSPILFFDGDKAGRAAASRACEMALPFVGPGGTLRVALCPSKQDPDDLRRSGGREAVEGVLALAVALSDYLFDAVLRPSTDAREALDGRLDVPRPPEVVSAIWHRLEELAATIADAETRAQYLGVWRARFEREVSHVTVAVPHLSLDVYTRSDDGKYVFPESEGDAEKRLIMIVKRKLELRRQRREIAQTDRDLTTMAKSIGFDGKSLTAVCAALEADPSARETSEATLALYRRVLGIKGPMTEAMMPPPLPAGVSARRVLPAKGTAQKLAWIDANDRVGA